MTRWLMISAACVVLGSIPFGTLACAGSAEEAQRGSTRTEPAPQADAPPRAEAPSARRHRMAIEHLKRTAADISNRSLVDIDSLAAWKRQRPVLRRELLYMLGLDPLPARTPLNARITGTLKRDGYRIEKLVFQSLPGLYVTGNFYVPSNEVGPLPTILYVSGHAPHPLGAKVQYQDRVAWFAAHGYASLILDTLEFGEIAGIHHGLHDLNMWHWLSLGYTPAGVEVWNAMRAIDYLETRPEVDAERIGMTGVSGGGATTWFTAAVDERVAVAVPGLATYTVGSQAAHWVAAGQCDCIYFHNTFRRDLPMVGALIAPRPLLFFSGQRDPDFPPDGHHEVHRRVKRVYDLYAAEGAHRVKAVDADAGHQDTPQFRRETRQWMNRWLRNDPAPLAEEPNPARGAEAAEALACLVRPPRDALNYHVQDLFTSPVRPGAFRMALRPKARRAELLTALREKVFSWFPRQRIPFDTSISTYDGGWARRYGQYRDVELTTEVGVRIRAQLLRPHGEGPTPLLIYAKRAGDSIYQMDLDELLPVLGRYTVLILNPRFTEHPVSPFVYAEIERSAAWVGRTIAAMQVWDILRAIQWATVEEKLPVQSLSLYGKGDMAIVALYAGLLDKRVSQVILRDPPASHWDGPPLLNVLRITDIAEVAGAFAPRRLVLVTRRPDSFDYAREVYEQLEAPDRFMRANSLAEALAIWKQ